MNSETLLASLTPEKQARVLDILAKKSLKLEDLDERTLRQLEERVLGEDAPWHYRAHIRVMIGEHKMCELMRRAGLGISGVGFRHDFIQTHAPGVVVDEARIQDTFQHVAAQLLEQGLELLSHEVIKLEKVENGTA